MSSAQAQFFNGYGGSLAGNVITSVVFGAITIQAHTYYTRFQRDWIGSKLLVAWLWSLQALQVICTTSGQYLYLIANFGNFAKMARANWELTIYQSISVFAALTVQSFFVRRVYKLSGNLWLGILLEILVLVPFGLGLSVAIIANILTLEEFTVRHTPLAVAWYATEAIADVAIAAVMAFLLRRRRTGFEGTDSLINRLVVYSVNTGAFTAILAIIILVSFARGGFTFTVTVLGGPLAGFYSVAVLSNLHMRTKLRSQPPAPQSDNIPLSELVYRVPGESSKNEPSKLAISVQSETLFGSSNGETSHTSGGATTARSIGLTSRGTYDTYSFLESRSRHPEADPATPPPPSTLDVGQRRF